VDHVRSKLSLDEYAVSHAGRSLFEIEAKTVIEEARASKEGVFER
jgi:hypothetical protein